MTTDQTAPVPPDANGLREAANPILSDALIYYAERRKMNNPKGWDHVARKVEQGLAADLWPHVEPEQVGQARRVLTLLAASEAAPTAGERECPTCGPTATEPHPRRTGVTRCRNCKEWLSRNGAAR